MRLARLLCLALPACSTLASAGSGDQDLPSSGVGPFQALSQTQVAPGDVAPYVFLGEASAYREPSVLPATSDPASPAVLMYVVAHGAQGDVIERTRADDGRSFYGDSPDLQNFPRHIPPTVLSATLAWEGYSVGGPSALRAADGAVWLYYAAAGGIGLARSGDGGRTFTKAGAPVLGLGFDVAWERTAPRAPSVAIFPDGTWHMLYASGSAIGEATSTDGVAWKRVDGDPSSPALDPVLVPSPTVDPKTLGPGERPPFDEGGVDDPLLLPRVDGTGALQVRVLYTGYGAPAGASPRPSSIGFAARYGVAGALARQAEAVYTALTPVAAPAYMQASGPAMLYAAQQNTSADPGHSFPAIIAAFDVSGGVPGPLATAPGSP